MLFYLDEATDTGTTRTNVNNALNQAHIQRLTDYKWKFMLWDTPITFPIVPGQRSYSLHQEFGRPFYFRNITTRRLMRETPSRNIDSQNVDWENDGENERFALWGLQHVQNQPSSPSVITIVSSSALDVGSTKAITVRGDTSDGVTTEQINPNGTTPVVGLVQFTKILRVTKAASWAGTMTMTSNSGAVTNLKLFPTELGRHYLQFYLLFNPASADTIQYRFYRRPSPLVNDNDIPDVPDPHSVILVWDALLLLAAYDSRIDPLRLAIWRDNQDRAYLAMCQAFLDGQSLGAEPKFLARGGDDDFGFDYPAVYTN